MNALADRDSKKKIFYLLNMLFYIHMGFIGATYIVFFYNQGLSKLSTNMLSSLFTISVFILEIPSGAYADVFGNRKTLLLSGLTLSLSMSMFFLGSHVFFFALAQITWGISFAFVSGALDSWIVNTLKLRDKESNDVFAKAAKINNFAMIISGLIGGLLAKYTLRWPWGLSLASALIYMILVYFYIQEEDKDDSDNKFSFQKGAKSIKNTIAKTIKYGVNNPIVKLLILFNVIVSFSFCPLFVYWSPYLHDLSDSGVWILGWIWLLIKVSNFAGNNLLEYILKVIKSEISIMNISIIVISVIMIIGAMSNTFLVVLIMFLLFEVLLGVLQPIQRSYINNYIPDDERATVLSFNSMMGRLSNFLALIVMGYLADKISISITWLISGFILLANLLVLGALYKKTREISQENNTMSASSKI